MTGPAGRVRRLEETRGSSRVGSGGVQTHGSGRVGSGTFQISRVGPDRPDPTRLVYRQGVPGFFIGWRSSSQLADLPFMNKYHTSSKKISVRCKDLRLRKKLPHEINCIA